MMEAKLNLNSSSSASNGGQFLANFPETFKDFFSMINEDEDHVELVSNVLEDKVIPRYNVRGRNRSSSAKYSNTTSLLPAVAVRSNSFRMNRTSSNSLLSSGTLPGTDFCKHIKYCCLHQNLDSKNIIDRTKRSDEYFEHYTSNSVGSEFKFDEMNANSSFSNYSDDEKSMKIARNFSVDASMNQNPTSAHNKQLQHSAELFESRKYKCENCSNLEEESDEFTSKRKTTNSSYCLMRYNRSQMRSSDKSSTGTSNTKFSFSSNSASTMHDNSTDSTPSRKQQLELSRQKSPLFNRRRASSITLARTVPNFGSQTPITSSPAHNPNEVYRYMKSEELQNNWSNQSNEQLHSNRKNESREKYTRSKSPNLFNQNCKTIDASAVSKANATSYKQRARTASMPAENRKPRLAETRRSAIHCADMDIEYYRLRSFSITSHGICNLGDSMRSRRSRSINSVTSSNSGRDRNNSTGSQHLDEIKELANVKCDEKNMPYKIAMLGDSGVGKSSLTYQFTTSEYICAYDLSLDDDYGQKTVSVLLNNQETDLEVIDHPACEMSVEAFCSTYSIDLFVIVYSIVDRKTFKSAERILLYLKENEMMLTRGAILVGNKTDLERQREVSTQAGRKLAKEIGCKFIESSSGLNHNVDELLVGIVAQVKLNPQRIRNLSEKQRNNLCLAMQPKFKETTERFSELRRNERNKNYSKNLEILPKEKCMNKSKGGKSNKENVRDDQENESDDERSSEENDSDIEKYFNLNDRSQKQNSDQVMATNISRLLHSRRYATPGMTNSHYGTIHSFFNDDKNNISSSSCSTPTTLCPQGASSGYNQTKTNKRDFTSYDSKTNPSISSQPETPKKTNLSEENDTSGERCMNKFSNRTKMFLTSFLKFKRSLRVKRRNSNSCSDLFVI